MPDILQGVGQLHALVRDVVVLVVGVLAVICLVDWLARTRRINPFHPIARFLRDVIDPLIAPIERRVVRAGGMPSAAPWWTLVAAVVLGIVLINVVDFSAGEAVGAVMAVSSGPRGIFFLVVHWTFWILEAALLVRVVVSWLPISPYSPWVRWAFVLSEPILRPLRGIIPTIGMFDITPIVAYFGLQLLEVMVFRIMG
jgi:YggT family protein